MRHSPRAIVFACALSALSRGAAAEMRFDVPDGCGSAGDFRAELEALGVAAGESEPSVLAIEPAEGGYRLHLELAGEIRELAHGDCRTLLRSAVVIVAAAARSAEPEPPPAAAVVEPPPPPPAPAIATAAPAVAEPAAPAIVEEQRVEPPPPPAVDTRFAPPGGVARAGPARWALGAGIGVSAGTVPGASAVLELRGGIEPAPVGLTLSARYWPGSGAESDGRSVHVTALGGRAAAVFELGSILHVSVGLEVDRLSGTGQEGVSRRSSDSLWLFAAPLELNAIPWSIDDLRIELGLGAQLRLVRRRFEVTGYGPVYEVPGVGGSAIIRAVWLFP